VELYLSVPLCAGLERVLISPSDSASAAQTNLALTYPTSLWSLLSAQYCTVRKSVSTVTVYRLT